jgi:hypothetical protein
MGKNVFEMKRVYITAQLTRVPNVYPSNERLYLRCIFIAFRQTEHEEQTVKELYGFIYLFIYLLNYLCFYLKRVSGTQAV